MGRCKILYKAQLLSDDPRTGGPRSVHHGVRPHTFLHHVRHRSARYELRRDVHREGHRTCGDPRIRHVHHSGHPGVLRSPHDGRRDLRSESHIREGSMDVQRRSDLHLDILLLLLLLHNHRALHGVQCRDIYLG